MKELNDAEIRIVAGGLNPQPLPPGLRVDGPQSSPGCKHKPPGGPILITCIVGQGCMTRTV